jgi:DHA1 family inner membrane transport protein
MPQLAASFAITIDKAGWLLSSFALIIAFSAPFMMLLFSRMDRKKAMALVLAVFAISNLISIGADSFTVLLLARMLPAFLHPVFWSIALATAATSVPAGEEPKAIGVVFGGFTIASVLGVPMVSYAADLYNWRASFVLCAVINVLSFAGLILLLPALPARHLKATGSPLQVLQRSLLWTRLLLAFLMISAMYSSYGYFAAYLQNITRMNGKEISIMLLLFGVAGIGGNWMAGRTLSKGIAPTTIAFIAALLIVHVLIYLAGTHFTPMIVLVFLWGFIHTAGFLISNVNVSTAAPDAPELVNSIFTSCGNLSVTIGTFTGGWVIAHAGIREVTWVGAGLLVLAAAVWGSGRKRSVPSTIHPDQVPTGHVHEI